MLVAADWPAWSLAANAEQLRRFVVPDGLRPLGRWVEPSDDPAITRLAALWERLRDSRIGYVAARDGGGAAGQLIRPPGEVLVAPGSGTCLDVAVLLAAACDLAGLASAVIIIEPPGGASAAHALVAVRLRGSWDLGGGGVWIGPPLGFIEHARDDITLLTGDVVVLDPVGITHPLRPSRVPGLNSTLGEAARRGYQLLTSPEWRWRFGITSRGPSGQPEDLFRPAARPDVLPLRSIYLNAGEQIDSPLRLLRADYQLTRFQDRDELTVLRDFAEGTVDGNRMGLALLIGAGGSGKTRLALEVAEQLRRDGWYAGPLAENLSEASVDWLSTVTAPLLVVVDYADARVEDTKRLLAALASRSGPPAVIILTARSGDGDWLPTIMDAATSGGQAFRTERLDIPDSHPRPQAIYRAAIRGSQQALGCAVSDDAEPERQFLERWTTLDVVLLGWLTAQGEDLPDNRVSLYNQVLTHERAYWDRTYREMTGAKIADRQLLGRAAAAVTLLGPTSRGQAAALIRRLPDTSENDAGHAARVLEACLRPGAGERLAIRPDPIGDHHALHTLSSDPGMLGRLLADEPESDPATHAVAVLTRAGTSEPAQATAQLQRAIQDDPRLWPAVLAVAVAVGGVAEDALLATLSRQPDLLPLTELSAHVPFTALGPTRLGLQLDETRYQISSDDPAARSELAVSLSERRRLVGDRAGALAAIDEAADLYRALAEANLAMVGPNLAMALTKQATLRSEMSYPAGALAAIDEAVALYRALAEANPTGFTANLAMALTIQASQRSQMGDPIGGLAAIDEALTLCRALAESNKAAFTVDLASALSVQAALLSQAGDRAGAVAVIDEATALYRALAQADTASFTPDLADKLAAAFNHQANLYSEVGDRAGALAAVEKAIDIYRALAAVNPAAFNPDLAMALNNQANQRSEMGDRAGALADIDDAVTLYRKLAGANPAAFTPYLAGTLTNQATLRSEMGNRASALAANDEAVGLYRRLAEVDPVAFTTNLAKALHNQAIQRSGNGDRAGALAAVGEAVTLYRKLAEANPAAHTPDLAGGLSVQAVLRYEMGDWAGGLVAVDEAVAFYRPLADANPAAFTPDLAMALNNQANLRYEMGDRAGGLVAVDQAVAFYRPLAEAEAAAFTPDLAMALTTQANLRYRMGDRAGGLTAIDEAAVLYRALAQANPAAFMPNLSAALHNQANQRSGVGDRAGALVAIDEAVTLRRALAEASPAAFTPDLANALTTQATVRAETGDAAGGIAAIDEAVSLYLKLAEANPGSFTPNLATALTNQANRRYGMADRAGSLAAIDEAVTVYRKLAEANPGSFTPNLATALNNQAALRSEVGDRAGAVAAIEEAVALCRALVAANPGAFTPNLATALINEAGRRSELRDDVRALAAVSEAVTLSRTLVQANPAAFTPDLARSTRLWATLDPAHGVQIWQGSREAVNHLHLRAQLTAAAAAWTAEHDQRDQAALLLHAAASEATRKPEDHWPSVPLSAVQAARAAVRQTVQNEGFDAYSLPEWVTAPVPEPHDQLASAATAARSWPQLADLLRQHAALFTDTAFRRTLDTLQILFPENSTLEQLAAIHDTATQHGLADVLDDGDRQYTRAITIQEWIATPTWDESFAYLKDHRDILATAAVTADLRQSGELVHLQHAAIIRLARYMPLDVVQEIVTDPTVATELAYKAVEDANLQMLRLLVGANRHILERPASGALLFAVLIAAGGQDPTEAIQQALQQMTKTQTKASRIRLIRLIANSEDEFRVAFTKLLAAYDKANELDL
jgi:hypothetical protein